MAETRKDSRFTKWILGLTGVAGFGGFAAYLVWGLWGIFCLVALAFCTGLGLMVWTVYFYTCPSCGRRLEMSPEETQVGQAVHHHCSQCDVTWNTGVRIGSTGDPQ